MAMLMCLGERETHGRGADGGGGEQLRAHLMQSGRYRRREVRRARRDESKDGINNPCWWYQASGRTRLEVGVEVDEAGAEADAKKVFMVTLLFLGLRA
jgi:hypothetical protein